LVLLLFLPFLAFLGFPGFLALGKKGQKCAKRLANVIPAFALKADKTAPQQTLIQNALPTAP